MASWKSEKIEKGFDGSDKPDDIQINQETFFKNYYEAEAIGLHLFDGIVYLMQTCGHDIDKFPEDDFKLLREAVISCIMKYRGQDHPLHIFAPEFNKYFSKLEERME
jgi:hypothetical protein